MNYNKRITQYIIYIINIKLDYLKIYNFIIAAILQLLDFI